MLLDVRKAGLDGFETAHRLSRVAPDTVVVLMSPERLADLPSSIATLGTAAYVRLLLRG